MNDFLIEWSPAKAWLPIESLMEKFNAEVSEKREFESREKSNIKAHFGNSGRLDPWHRDENEWFYNQIHLYKCEIFDSGPDGRNQTSKTSSC